MPNWSLPLLLASLHDDIQCQLARARQTLAHPVTKGDASEKVWLALLQTYLPKRYQAERAHVVDSRGAFSDQIDVVIFDRQYSPFILTMHDQIFVPAESVYAAFEAKQEANRTVIQYAQRKLASVRRLHRTSLPIPHAGGVYRPKPLSPIIGGLLSLDSSWQPPMGTPFKQALATDDPEIQLDIGCVASNGIFWREEDAQTHVIREGCKPATGFLLKLIALLQAKATVPMVDTRAYEAWLSQDDPGSRAPRALSSG